MSAGPFWITAERLKMVSFTIPLVYDKTYLVVPKPGNNQKLSDQIAKVVSPFSTELWFLLIAVILFTALLSVWFAAKSDLAKDQDKRKMSLRRKKVIARLALDNFLEKGNYFFFRVALIMTEMLL